MTRSNLMKTLICMSFLTCIGCVKPVEWTGSSYPNPEFDPVACGNHIGSICDPDSVLGDKAGIALLGALIAEVDRDSCACGDCPPLQKNPEENEGFKIGIAAVDKLKADSGSDGNVTWELIDLESFAAELLTKWKLGSCRNGLIIAISNWTGQYATASDRTTNLRLHPECLEAERSNNVEATRLINEGHNIDGIALLVKDYKQMIKVGSCLMTKTIWLIIAFTLAPVGIIFAICYLACRSSNYVIKSAREKRTKQMMHKKLEEYSSTTLSETSSSSSSSDDDRRRTRTR